MKNWIYIATLSILLSCSNNSSDSDETKTLEFQNLTINYHTGDKYLTHKQLQFDFKSNQIEAQLVEPNYFIGNTKLKPEPKIVDKKDLDLLKGFLKKVNSYKDTCKEAIISSSAQDYQIIIDNDTISIERYCDWGQYSYENLEKEIFEEYFSDLENGRRKLINELEQNVKGKWYPILVTKQLKRGDTLKLIRTPKSDSVKNCYWSFTTDNFQDHCSELLDLKYSRDYRWNVTSGSIHFIIGPGAKQTVKNGDTLTSIENYGATFTLINLDSENFKLEYL